MTSRPTSPPPPEDVSSVRTTDDVPAGLEDAGRALWSSIVGVWDLRPDERIVLEHAARESDLLARLDAALEGQSFTVKGSQGQPVAHPMIGELRAHRSTLASLLARLRLPDEQQDRVVLTASEAARKVARARWDNRGANRGA